jgi:hypothetical protein
VFSKPQIRFKEPPQIEGRWFFETASIKMNL